MNTNTSTINNYLQSTDIEFWTLVVAIVAIIATVIISWIERHQSARLNSINLLNKSLEEPFNEYLISNFCLKVVSCKYNIISSNRAPNKAYFDRASILDIQNVISFFLGDIAYLQYAIPFRFFILNSLGNDIILFIENHMLPHSLQVNGTVPEVLYDKIIKEREAKKLHKKFIRKIKRFYKQTFRIYKYGL